MNKGTSVFASGLIWFGAAVSVAEIEAGIQSGNNWAALILGHILGGFMLFAVGLMGASLRKNAMETTEGYFGRYGSKFFAGLNIFQLVGWTSVMISQAASALAGLNNPLNFPLTCVLLAILVAIWIFIGLKNAVHIATAGMAFLAVLVTILTYKLSGSFFTDSTFANAQALQGISQAPQGLSFWQAFELSLAMPLSWLPLVSDYTKNASRPIAATATSSAVYTVVSIWMYGIGIAIANAVSTGVIDKATLPAIVIGLGLGIIGILIIVFSTVTTTFLDAYSAGESAKAICKKINPKIAGVITCIIGAICAITGIFDHYADFLYLIASVFAPLAAVLITSHYIVLQKFQKNVKSTAKNLRVLHAWNTIAWFIGFLTYQFAAESPIGPSLTAILVSAILVTFALLFSPRSA